MIFRKNLCLDKKKNPEGWILADTNRQQQQKQMATLNGQGGAMYHRRTKVWLTGERSLWHGAVHHWEGHHHQHAFYFHHLHHHSRPVQNVILRCSQNSFSQRAECQHYVEPKLTKLKKCGDMSNNPIWKFWATCHFAFNTNYQPTRWIIIIWFIISL